MRHTELKAKLEDLVDRTGRVEDMLKILSGIYRERARHPEYADPRLHKQMRATAHARHEASDVIAMIFEDFECEKDFEEYEEMFKASGGKSSRRPRSCVPLRAGALRALAKMKCQIAFGDAIGTFDAAKILGVHFTLVSRLVTQGKIVGRVLYSKRSGAQRSWIFSRASCEKEKAENRMTVGMPGRKRNPS